MECCGVPPPQLPPAAGRACILPLRQLLPSYPPLQPFLFSGSEANLASLSICNEDQKASLTLLSGGMGSTRSLKCSLLKGKPLSMQFLPVSFREPSASPGLFQRGGIPCSESLARRHSGGVRSWTLHTEMQLCFK